MTTKGTTVREEIKKQLNSFSKEDLIDAILLSPAVTGFVLSKCKNKVKPAESKRKKEGA